MALFCAIIAVILGSVGQVCLKLGVDELPLTKAILQPLTLSGYVLYGASSLFWLLVLKKLPLSVAYPILSLNYVFVLILSVVFLKEQVNVFKMTGVVMIIAGVALIGKS